MGGFLSELSPPQKHLWEMVEWGGMEKLQSVLSIGEPDKIAEEYTKLRQVRPAPQHRFFTLASDFAQAV